jgi:hypothetical protein
VFLYLVVRSVVYYTKEYMTDEKKSQVVKKDKNAKKSKKEYYTVSDRFSE